MAIHSLKIIKTSLLTNVKCGHDLRGHVFLNVSVKALTEGQSSMSLG